VNPIGNPARDRSQAATAMVDDAPAGSAVLSVRVCTDNGPAEIWDDASLECALARDLIQASGGIPAEMGGPVLSARFDTIAAAALAARRLQWSAQGLSEDSHPYALSILIQSGDEVARAGHETPPPEFASAGSILVTDSAARLLEDVPGFSVRSKENGAEFREMSWRAAPSLTTREADEQALATMMEQNGRSVEAVPLAPPPELETSVHPEAEEIEESGRRLHALLWVAVAALLVAGAVAGFFYFRTGPEPQRIAAAPPAQQIPATNPATAEPRPATTEPSSTPTSSAPASAGDNKSASSAAPPLTRKQRLEQERKQKEQEQKNKTPQAGPTQQPDQQKPPDVPKEPSGNCTISSDDYATWLNRAERSRGAGNYKDAKRLVQTVLSCDHSNARARQLLDLINRAEAAGDGSPNSD